jgi:hypothetical protein
LFLSRRGQNSVLRWELPMNLAYAASPFVIQSASEGSHKIGHICEIPRHARNDKEKTRRDAALHPRCRAKQFIGLFQAPATSRGCLGSMNDNPERSDGRPAAFAAR